MAPSRSDRRWLELNDAGKKKKLAHRSGILSNLNGRHYPNTLQHRIQEVGRNYATALNQQVTQHLLDLGEEDMPVKDCRRSATQHHPSRPATYPPSQTSAFVPHFDSSGGNIQRLRLGYIGILQRLFSRKHHPQC